MATKDYYLILGVLRWRIFRGIQEAFRELAKRYHPDRAGPGATYIFGHTGGLRSSVRSREKKIV